MPDPTFTAAPAEVPSRAVPSTFSALTDPFLVWTKTFRDELSSSVAWFSAAVASVVANAAQVALDRIATAADAAQTALDRIQTVADALSTTNNLAAFRAGFIGSYADDAAANASGFTIGAGVFYFRDTGVQATSGLRIYNGGWSAAVLDTAGALMAVNDLSDVTSAENARNNLGLRWLTKSTTYTASSGEKIAADVTAGAWTLTLPPSPDSGDVVMVSVIDGDAAANNLTIDGNGNNIYGDTTLIYDVPLSTVWLVYNNTEWRLA
jgi:hypothetical protein